MDLRRRSRPGSTSSLPCLIASREAITTTAFASTTSSSLIVSAAIVATIECSEEPKPFRSPLLKTRDEARLPSERYPSDHFAIAAKFEISR